VEPADNAALEEQLAAEKVALKAQKEELARLTETLETKGRVIASSKFLRTQLQRLRD
jgi:hypothetical protein